MQNRLSSETYCKLRNSIDVPIGELPFEYVEGKGGRFQYERASSENTFCVWDLKLKRRCTIKILEKNNMQTSLLGYREFILGKRLPPSHFVTYIENHTFTQELSPEVLNKLEKFQRPLDFSSEKLDAIRRQSQSQPYLLMDFLDGYTDLDTLRKRRIKLGSQDMKKVIVQTLHAISLLGKMVPPLIHRGIRTKNILWNAELRKVKISGCDNIIEATEPHMDRLGGADWAQYADWLPTEACGLVTHVGAATSVDVYSVAGLVIDLVHAKRDKNKERLNQMEPKVIMQQIPSKVLRQVGLSSDILMVMLARDPTRRPLPDILLQKIKYQENVMDDYLIPTLEEISGVKRTKQSLEKVPQLGKVIMDSTELHDKIIELFLRVSRHEAVSVYRLVCILDFLFKACAPIPQKRTTIDKFAKLATILVQKARGYLDAVNLRKINDMVNYWTKNGWIPVEHEPLTAHPIQPIQPSGHIARIPGRAPVVERPRGKSVDKRPRSRTPAKSVRNDMARSAKSPDKRQRSRTPAAASRKRSRTPTAATRLDSATTALNVASAAKIPPRQNGATARPLSGGKGDPTSRTQEASASSPGSFPSEDGWHSDTQMPKSKAPPAVSAKKAPPPPPPLPPPPPSCLPSVKAPPLRRERADNKPVPAKHGRKAAAPPPPRQNSPSSSSRTDSPEGAEARDNTRQRGAASQRREATPRRETALTPRERPRTPIRSGYQQSSSSAYHVPQPTQQHHASQPSYRRTSEEERMNDVIRRPNSALCEEERIRLARSEAQHYRGDHYQHSGTSRPRGRTTVGTTFDDSGGYSARGRPVAGNSGKDRTRSRTPINSNAQHNMGRSRDNDNGYNRTRSRTPMMNMDSRSPRSRTPPQGRTVNYSQNYNKNTGARQRYHHENDYAREHAGSGKW